MTYPMQNPGSIYPTRKRRILENFPLETSHNQERSSYDCEDLDDEVEVLCVVSKRPPRAGPEAPPRLPYLEPPLYHPVTLLPRDDYIGPGKRAWPCPPTPPSDDPSYHMDDLPRPLKPPPRTDWKMLHRLSDDTWIEVEVPIDGLNYEGQVSPLPFANTLQSVNEPYDHYNLSHSSPTNYYYPVSLPTQAYESSSPTYKHPVQRSSRATETLRYSSSSPQKALNRAPLFDSEPCPRRDMRQAICSICMAPAESFYLNFGAISCSSCRAFFRRCVLKNLYQGLVCHYGQRCVLTVDNRNDCRKCRFDKCVQQGMKCSAVLSHTQKTTRFRKHIASKQLQKLNEKMELKRTLRTFRRTRPQKVSNDASKILT